MMNIFIVLSPWDSSWQVPLSPGNYSWQSLTNRAWLTFQTSQTLKHFYSYSAACGEQLRRSHQPNIQTLRVFWKRNATSWSDQVVMENCKSLQKLPWSQKYLMNLSWSQNFDKWKLGNREIIHSLCSWIKRFRDDNIQIFGKYLWNTNLTKHQRFQNSKHPWL